MLRYIVSPLLIAFCIIAYPATGVCAPNNFDAGQLGFNWVIPFVGMLLSIAIMPLAAPSFWHHHLGKIAVFWGLAFLIPFGIVFGLSLATYEFLHVFFLEYIPFIVLLFSLYTVAGGIRLKGSLVGTPLVNTGLLLIGTLFASWMGTTGAAMLLIRPLLRANEHRRYKVHSCVFFIFLVANVGGCLTPLGDPPLFLGFLKGVSFFWTFEQLIFPMLFLCTLLLILYYCVDTYLYKKEGSPVPARSATASEKLGLEGLVNIPLLGGIIVCVLLSGIWKPEVTFTLYDGVTIALQEAARDILLFAIAMLSLYLTSNEIRERNGFNWGPIDEVAKLFIGIFTTMAPAIGILKAGSAGALAPVIALVTLENGQPDNAMYFWLTGIFSGFLDNAPTYLVFFNIAGGNAGQLMTEYAATLTAISAGAVFMGALTYIGNAPNFMVRSIAEDAGVIMPGFFSYIGWSCLILLPLFVIVQLLFL